MAECDRKKKTFCGGREEDCQGGVKQTFGELLVYCSGLDCACMYFPLAIVRIFVYYIICSILLPQLRAPASLEGGIIEGVSGYKTAHRSTRSSFVRLFVSLHSCSP